MNETSRWQSAEPRDLEAGGTKKRLQDAAGSPELAAKVSSPAYRTPETATWLTYAEGASYTGWSIGYLRNLVSAGRIPVYGPPRVRRFRRDMLDLYLTNPDMAMRKFQMERNATHGR